METEQEKHIEVTLITSNETTNPVILKILHSVNTYLLKNKGAVSDFNLIKDIVDRNTDAVDEEINNLLPIPLYLGLVGTMVGIVIGLFLMPSISDENFDKSIDTLIGGVKIAMVASFVGLLLTIILSGWKYKGAKAQAESLKNDFFTWIQTNLLPVLSQNISSSIYSLQANLLKFNDTFSVNINIFNTLMGKTLNSFDSQVELMNELKQVDVVQLAALNVNVLKELRTSSKEFEKFNSYLGQLNIFVDNAQKLNYNISSQLERTQSIENIAQTIGSNIEVNKNMIGILQSELNEMNLRKQYVKNAVIDVDDSIKKMLDGLKTHIEAQIHAIKEITIKEEDLLEKILKDDRGNLDELKKLGDVKMSIESLGQEGKKQNDKLDQLIEVLRSQKAEKNSTDAGLAFLNREKLPSLIRFSLVGLSVSTGFVFLLVKVLNYLFS